MKKALLVFIIFLVSTAFTLYAINNINNVINIGSDIKPLVRYFPSYIDKQLSKMTLRQKIASLLILHKSSSDTTVLSDYLSKYQPAGLIFMSDNIPGSKDDFVIMTKSLQTNKSLPYLFAIDQEGGIVRRLNEDVFPAAVELKSLPVDETKTAFSERSKILQNVGMNLNFGIISDITNNPNSFIYQRTFGGDTTVAGDRVAAAVDASKKITLSTIKHFTGHGEADADSHNSIPTTSVSIDGWRKYDAVPFIRGIDAGADFVMFGHLRYSSVDLLPASLSLKWHNILTDELGFKGISITDDMLMLQNSGESQYSDPIKNAIDAINAGNNSLLYILDHGDAASDIDPDEFIDGITEAVDDGRISQRLINQNARQVLMIRRSIANY